MSISWAKWPSFFYIVGMNPERFAELLIQVVLSTDQAARQASQRMQRELLVKISSLINSNSERFRLDLTASQQIKPTAKNIRKLSNIKAEIENFLAQAGYYGLPSIVSGFDEIQQLSDNYFSSEFSKFKPNRGIQQHIFQAAKDRAAITLTTSMQNEAILKPIQRIVDTATAAGGATRAELIRDMGELIRGADGKVGAIQSYTSRYVRDALNTTARAYNEAATGFIDQGDRWYLYTSGTVEDSRPFCIQRNGKYYHFQEVSAWPRTAGNWQGRAAGTNERTIFVLLGGYNCMHQLILVSKSRIPGSVIRRAKDQGFTS